ncbi:hypothetical protein COW36_06680 [bacterium (Candidatus Blackallbacteria) CG17_big_fil_post_rev_8_21_14_2_50_48_46]|uniref:Uncharacterized protein n=1 Tax=bacterium (Candidatus Blackallbacteria) CG17_big_fil_post_rev_8_21_14_2_50_48_46 TaxID=2014261 RepID=A0A2M7G7D2_9BACT|nr:MAG: hypothetical protein COW64_12095 [bacterium (Candidatus Blackallbacteria) CG18_big_fil_WC_8_21_14_2_50_49_26]PIW17957.1 MAG: hypothetical protein COW36_06680 [bacterium (Candidatus Blackallbacteria) CG17_big_fil_post_rev_8_21_14_2_50_48_46]
MDKPLFYSKQLHSAVLNYPYTAWFWKDESILAGEIGPFPTRSDAETDWAAAHMIEGCRQDLHALNIAVEMPVLNLNQADIDLMLDIQQTRKAVENYATEGVKS